MAAIGIQHVTNEWTDVTTGQGLAEGTWYSIQLWGRSRTKLQLTTNAGGPPADSRLGQILEPLQQVRVRMDAGEKLYAQCLTAGLTAELSVGDGE